MLDSYGCNLAEKVGSNDSLFQVRSYQRFYVWSEEKVKIYLDDIQSTVTRYGRDNSIVHFFGQMIFLEMTRDGRNRKTYEVIDGQQRLTTFLMTIAALIGKAKKLAQEFPTIRDAAETLEKECNPYLKSVKEGVEPADKLVLPSQDNDYYQSILIKIQTSSCRNHWSIANTLYRNLRERLFKLFLCMLNEVPRISIFIFIIFSQYILLPDKS